MSEYCRCAEPRPVYVDIFGYSVRLLLCNTCAEWIRDDEAQYHDDIHDELNDALGG